ncbi:hypothetical protein, variant [Cryptococcus amylolentus CBS 6039]|uniref:DNL-type domain-containing protein n=2 Tax=Cryptococcus amylolentus TaxID=104669 RepID=A0A1E3HQY6_9TREE|nr:hypothetical protein L202_04300 [Cryptococcus amylolentus CBS 6039]XP_018993783.1 hypothetical protein, variant [Cryptococcus amylolentus CBS 6039]ODN78736.1 hypothetical protein L202_04300 [Cryptococcus amylolentus CBS 6039]ODN78737.1 hypothetical protein, variant [Cryptococcus amylolentus CBS 6039]ODO06759.1 hypothetical protein I350_04118 [Cryptococcus amylolentus CBS 6273]
MSALRTSLIRSARSLPSSSRLVAFPRQAALQQLRPSEAIFRRWNSSANHNPAIEAPLPGSKPQKIAQIEPRLQMTFTCTADGCGHRSTHEFAKRSYEKGIVLVQCPECKNRHLIADHLGWFKESLEDGKLKTVEDLLRAKGEKVKKGRVNFDGDIEIDGE